MSIAILLLDMPKSCLQCNMLNGSDECVLQDDDDNFNADTFDDLRAGCPLKPMPEKNRYTPMHHKSYVAGWNDCIDAIVGKEG